MNRRVNAWLTLLLTLCIARVWLMPLPSSLWVDELVTFFVVRHPGDPSFAVAPQVPLSIYYWLPRASLAIFGDSEIALRLPSILAMAAALYFIARLAAKLIHPAAAWFAVFAALAFRNFDYFAVDARPYGLGIAVASASVLFLIRWFDEARLRDAALFVLLAALLWRIHLFYWPFYLLYLGYAAAMCSKRPKIAHSGVVGQDSRGTLGVRPIGNPPDRLQPVLPPRQVLYTLLAAAVLACALAPVATSAIDIAREGEAHKFNELPTLRNLFYLAHGFPILVCLGAMWLLKRIFKWRDNQPAPAAAVALIAAWWLVCPLCLFLYSRITGNGVLIMRYCSLMLPGIALAVTAIAARFLPPTNWKPFALCMGALALALTADWTHLWPAHEHDNWRDAAARERTVAVSTTPVLCPSPFIEAHPPIWTPNYPFPSFLYSHLQFYPLNGRLRLFPFRRSAESDTYLGHLLTTELLPARKFVTYGSTWSVQALDRWFSARPETASWHKQSSQFDNLSVVVYSAMATDRF